ncbi:MAG: hypothetical protein QXJ31_05095 [Candidatus Bathyarchaeia archaeon]
MHCIECGKPIVQKSKTRRKRFCSRKCNMRWYMRKYYQTHKEKVKEAQRRWEEKQVLKHIRVLVPLPPPCVCGSRKYKFKYVRPVSRFGFHSTATVKAICLKCGDSRIYMPEDGEWGPCHLFRHRKDERRKIGSIFFTDPYIFVSTPFNTYTG